MYTHPYLDQYGDRLEKLEEEITVADEPTDTHVRLSYMLQRRVASVRRYSWNMRELVEELAQDNWGLLSEQIKPLLGSIVSNTDNVQEVATAFMLQCEAIEGFFDSFQEKLMNKTLYVLTIATIVILPAQFLTGLYGMNFGQGDNEDQMNELHWTHGYTMFWVLSLVLTLLVCVVMWRLGFMKKRSTAHEVKE